MGSQVWMQGTMVFLVECLQVSRQGRTSWEDPGPGEWIPDRTRTGTVTFSNCSQNEEVQRWLP